MMDRINLFFAKLSPRKSVLLLLVLAIVSAEILSSILWFLFEGKVMLFFVFVAFVVTFIVALPIISFSIATIKNLDRSKASLKEANQSLRAVITASPLPIVFLDPVGKVKMWNPAAERSFGWTKKEVLGKPLPIVAPEQRHEHETLHEKTLRGEEVSGVELRRRRKDGSPIDVTAWTAPLRDASGESVGVLSVLADMTERKQAEEELRATKEQAQSANRAKSDFLAKMSHELRTPLNAIIGFSEIIKDGLLGPVGTPKYVEYAHDIHSSGAHLLDIINDILDMSKIEAGGYELQETLVDLPSCIDFAVRMFGQRAHERGIGLETQIEDGLPPLWGDERIIRQMLINLLSNAIKFTPEGGAITLEASRQDDGGIALAVADNGIGIAADDVPKVLEPFGQVESAFTRAHTGTGLGLPLVKLMVDMHGGHFGLNSEPGEGTTVTLSFPPQRCLHGRKGATGTLGSAR